MDLVLGISMTSNVVRWVLVDGITGEGAPVDRGALDIADVEAFDAEALLETLLPDGHVHAVGLTWSPDADAAAIKVREALAALGGGAKLVAVSNVEATEVLARGIADIAGHDFLVVCIVEPDATVVATVDGQRVTVERIDRADSVALIDRVGALVQSARPSPDAIFVLGSDDAEPLVSALREETTRPVITAAEADFALTRGAALASARTINVADAPVVKPRISRVGVLSSVLAAAVVVFVVSLSLAVGLQLTPESNEQPRNTSAVEQSVRPAAPPSIARATAAPPPAAPPPAPAPEVAPAEVPEVAPAAEPVYIPPEAAPVEPPPVYQPPAPEPVYVPPAPPAFVPPAAPPPVPPQPRLRDRIIDKIPLLNRFN